MANINSLNIYLANLAVLNIKMYNLHWNVVGREFKTVHKMTEKIYKELQRQFDMVAETIKMQGELPMATMEEYLQNSMIEEIESRDYGVGEVLDIIDEDCEKIMDLALGIRHEADEEDNFMIVSMFEEFLSGFYKTSWFIKSMMVEEEIFELDEWEALEDMSAIGSDEGEMNDQMNRHAQKKKMPKKPKKNK